jgi:ABC-type polysaccharide/polyol phosphate transport system ATPase subunit
MSSERDLLLRARGIGKTFTSPLAPGALLWRALTGREPTGVARYEVLRAVDVDVWRGETVGILGRNGAGKSTLLGILGNVLAPTTGTVERRGRIAVLLEIGAGFHPHFSGRDNARLFCSIMGMSRAETEARLPGIEEFADIGEYFDLPIRTYSSGMHARLAFAAAVHVDADLIILDETLAVGDASFRMKCFRTIERMKQTGQTFLLVSHNQNVIANFCTRALVLEQGRKLFDGNCLEANRVYKEVRTEVERRAAAQSRLLPAPVAGPAGALSLTSFRFREETDPEGRPRGIVEATLQATAPVARPVVTFGIRNGEGVAICAFDSRRGEPLAPIEAGEQRPLTMSFHNCLTAGAYYVSAIAGEEIGDDLLPHRLHAEVLRFDVLRQSATQGIVDLELAIRAGSDAARR